VGTAALSAIPVLAGEPVYLWTVESESATVTLVGSVHFGRPDFYPLPEVFEENFAEAEVLAVEVDISDPKTMAEFATIMTEKGFLPRGVNLQDKLGTEAWDAYVKYANSRGIDPATYSRYKPGVATLILMQLEYVRAGFDPQLGIDMYFLNGAKKGGKEIRSLETIAEQMDIFIGVTDELDDVLLVETLEQMDQLGPETDRMIQFWKAGDAEGLDAMMQDQVGEDPAMIAFYRELLDDRNVKMAATIDAWLGEDEDVFVVVGAGHFGGEMGIIALLEKEGWTIEQGAGAFATAE
jgi:uncharacterized protein YbaP (TraB family)